VAYVKDNIGLLTDGILLSTFSASKLCSMVLSQKQREEL